MSTPTNQSDQIEDIYQKVQENSEEEEFLAALERENTILVQEINRDREVRSWFIGLIKVDPDLKSKIELELLNMMEEGKSQEERDKYLIDQHAHYQQKNGVE